MRSSSTSRLIANFLLFQIGWLACVLSAAWEQPLYGALCAFAIVVWHISRAHDRGGEFRLVLLVTVIGLLWDSLLVWQGLLVFSSGMLLPFLAPYWIILMWSMFATTLNVSLRWLRTRYLWAAVFGALGGPLAYYAGQRLGAVEFSSVTLSLAALAAGWALIMPAILHLSRRHDGYAVITK
jgi:hypothetical protein